MSLGGSRSPCGELVDAAIVVVEQTHKKLEVCERSGRRCDYDEVILEAVKEVGGPTLLRAAGDRGVVPAGAGAGRRRKGSYSGRSPTRRTSRCWWRPFWRLRSTRRCGCCSFARARPFGLRSTWLARHCQRAARSARSTRRKSIPSAGALMRMYEPVVRWTLRWKAPVIGAPSSSSC